MSHQEISAFNILKLCWEKDTMPYLINLRELSSGQLYCPAHLEQQVLLPQLRHGLIHPLDLQHSSVQLLRVTSLLSK
jgi:hypothetical protein